MNKFTFILILLCSGCIIKQKALELPPIQAMRFVKATLPIKGYLSDKVSFVGFIEPRLLLNLHFLVAGRIQTCVVKEGQILKKGQEICKLDMSAVKLEVARADNALQAAQRVMSTNLAEKQKALFEAGVIGQSEFEQVRVQSESARAQYSDSNSLHEMALKRQKEHILIAPWNGTLLRLLAKPGQPIVPEIPAAILSDEKTVQISAELHANYFSKLKVGSKAFLRMVSSVNLPIPIELEVAEKAIAVSPDTQSFRVVMRPSKSETITNVTSGVLVTGDIMIQESQNITKIPQSALINWSESGKAKVFTVSDNRLQLTDISTGILDNGWVEIVGGVNESARIVTQPAPDFISGMQVEVE